VTHPPHDPTNPDPSAPQVTEGELIGPEPEPRRGRTGIAVGATVAGVLALGGVGWAAAAYLGGGGPQPADVLPADTLGFVTLDLDPAVNQKAAVSSLLEKFPDLREHVGGDLRGDILSPVLDEVSADLDFDADVAPWLGDRMAVAAVPAPGTDAGVVPVLALAVTDEEAMADTLTDVRTDADFGFAVRDDYVLVTDTQERADDLAAAEEVLADAEAYAGDREALGGDHVAIAWFDLDAVQGVLPAEMAGGMPFGATDLTGRAILGLHAESDALELHALDFGMAESAWAPTEPTRLIEGLPEDTVAAVSVGGLGDAIAQGWEEIAAGGMPPEFQDGLAALGLQLPEDLRVVFGSDVAVALSGDLAEPQVGVRADTDDPARATEVLDALVQQFELPVPLVPQQVEGGYVLATDEATAGALADDGGLGDSERFRAAVGSTDEASAVGYVDLAAIIDQLRADGNADADRVAPLDTLGFTSTPTDEGSRFVLRVTTR
jgi:hypothetical protein